VTLVQAARVLAIVFVLPFWLQFVGGLPLGGAMPSALHIWQLPLVDAVIIVAIAWAGWKAAERLGLFGGSIVGPMVLSAGLHVLALTTVKVPVEVLIVTQISIGIVIGGQFRGISLREFVTILSWGFAFAFLLVIAAAAMTLLTARLTGLDATALLLSYAPGGQNEMAVMALILGLDVAIVALHHLMRVTMVILGAQVVFKGHGWTRQPPPDGGTRH
jgi:membrane AbrB-like protein